MHSMVQGGKKTYGVREMTSKIQFLGKVLRNEYLERDPRNIMESINHRLSVFSSQKEIALTQVDGE